ncbi:MAG: type II toxin-antitoxin system PemK/MazF family toxin [Bosea sp. (in: a-proteobacteria)]
MISRVEGLVAAPWQVVLVPFPYADKLAEKLRPALVISAANLPMQTGLCWLAMITSTQLEQWPGDVVVTDMAAGGLPVASRVRTAKIATVACARIARIVGQLSSADQSAVHQALLVQLAPAA